MRMKNYSESLKVLAENRKKAPLGSLWFHRKTKATYSVVDHVLLEHGLSPAVVYTSGGVDWCREADEFFDGRFDPINQPERFFTSHNTETSGEDYLPPWAERRAYGRWEVRAALATRDGRMTGNGVITAFEEKTYDHGNTMVQLAVVVTDAGNILRLTESELEQMFYPPQWIMWDLLPAHSNALIEELDLDSPATSS